MGLFKTNTTRWPGGIVPFTIHSSIALNAPTAVAAIQSAVSHWNSTPTKIRLVPKKATHFNHVEFILSVYKGFRCTSKIGMQGGRQTINCGVGALALTLSSGTIVHEIGHAIGLKHEHQRFERDDFVTFDDFVAFYVAGAKQGDYAQLGPPYYLPVGKYDIKSVMHYRTQTVTLDGKTYAYFKPKKPKLTPGQFGSQGTLTARDIATVNTLYP